MRSKVSKWGNSLGLRVPNHFVRALGLDSDSDVDLELRDDSLVVTPIPRIKSLSELVNGITPDNLHSEIDTGSDVGAEIIDE